MQGPTHHTLTRTRHQVAGGAAPHEPEVLETYIDGADGEKWTGGYLRHAIGDSQIVSPHVARVVMTDPGLRRHYACEPPVEISEAETSTDHIEGAVAAAREPDPDEPGAETSTERLTE